MTSRPLPPPPPPPTHNNNLRVLLLSVTISGSVLIVLLVIFIFLYLFFSIINGSRTSPLDSSSPLKLQRFSYKDLKSATSSFRSSNELGKGGSSTVFRGILSEGLSVAVKRLDSSSLEAEREFQNELQVLGGLRSPFLVSLLGFCVEKKRRILVYEFMPNRSLQEALFADGANKLDWEKRFKIIIDIAEAIKFLHLECDPPVIHGDIKPSNVLLSSDFRAKMADFGLSRVKTEEKDFGIELFSQDLGKSQELLWKSQEDLSKNNISEVAATPVGVEFDDGNQTEVDFALALQASSSSSCYVTVEWNAKAYNNFNLLNEDRECSRENFKGKEVSTIDVGEDWSKFGPSDDEFCSFDHSKELNAVAAASSSPVHVIEAKQWGKDWWWRQDGSGELCSKDYVMEWIGSQICPSSNPDWDEKKGDENPNLDINVDSSVKKLDCREEMQVGELSFQGPDKREGKSCSKKKHRKIKEWWKEEYFAEMSKKGNCNKFRTLDKKWKSFKMAHFCKKLRFRRDLGLARKLRSRTDNREKERSCEDGNQNPDLSFRNGWKKKKNQLTGSEMWSGDLFSRELSSTTSMRGTVCYVAPEYGGCGYLMEKADIYSFGVLILVIVSGRRPLHVLSSPMKLEKANLISWARHLARAGNILDLIDPSLKGIFSKEQASLCINLALMCLQRMPEFRPDIGEIVKILKGEMELPTLPFEFSPSPPCKLSSKSRSRRKLATEAE